MIRWDGEEKGLGVAVVIGGKHHDHHDHYHYDVTTTTEGATSSIHTHIGLRTTGLCTTATYYHERRRDYN